MFPVIRTQLFKYNDRIFKGNACMTPNGTEVVNCGGFYRKITKDGTISKSKTWYIGEAKYNDILCEVWQSEKKDKNGDYKIVETHKEIKRGDR